MTEAITPRRHARRGGALRPARWATLVGSVVALHGALLSSGAAFAQSYRVHATPVESPNHGVRTLVTAPQDPVSSPFGWHDTDGVSGAEFTTLRGNNAYVYVDQNSDDAADTPGPDGGSALVFDFAVDFSQPPNAYFDALATNAFYWTNRLHDIFQRHGFTPARGNMQTNTYGLGGIGNDAVRVELAKGGQINNVVPVIAPDGTSPTIRHYLWTSTTPNREPSFDAGIMAVAYTYLSYNRLTGGCNNSGETPIIGFSDYVGLLVTTDFNGTSATTPRSLGTYLLGQPTNGAGVRFVPYSTDLTVFPRTYATLPSLSSPQATGTVLAATLWDLTWAMKSRYGASDNLLQGNGAENRMLRLVIEGMDTLPCPAGFVSARDSILAADQTLHGGQDRCMIWKAFARRGLGVQALQGSASSTSDQTASFDTPSDCTELFRDGFE